MSQTFKTYFNWSSGKDAAFALYRLQQESSYDISRLITTVNAHYQRVSMHGLRRTFLEQQAAAVGIPLTVIELPEQPTMEEYNQIMNTAVEALVNEGFTHCSFGDIFLEDLRAYREAQLQPLGIMSCFPLWKQDTSALIREFLELGFKAIVICINANLLDDSFLGRVIDEAFIDDLPAGVDPCGENGEFHTFCFDGPIFTHPIAFQLGEKVTRAYPLSAEDEAAGKPPVRFSFIDLIPQ